MVLSSTEAKHMRELREPEDSGNVGSAKPLVNEETDNLRRAILGSKELRGNCGRAENKRLGAANEPSQRSSSFMTFRGPPALIDKLPGTRRIKGRPFYNVWLIVPIDAATSLVDKEQSLGP
jgi:hypothetical protein